MNPLRNNQNNNLRDLYELCQNPNKARTMIEQTLGNNPMFQAMATNGDYKALYEALCQARGINPQAFINELKSKI